MRPLLLSLALFLPVSAAAQVQCPPGLLSPDQIHCCWPGQTWSSESRACAGAPECPASYQAVGNDCQPAHAAPIEPVAPAAPAPDEGRAPVINYPAAVPAMPVGPQATVTFRAADSDDQFQIAIEGATCTTPCTIVMATGKHKVRVTGSASFSQNLRLTNGPVEVTVEKRNGGMLKLGVASLAVGGGLVIVGLIVAYSAQVTAWVQGTPEYDYNGDRVYRDNSNAVTVRNVALVAAGTGAVVAVVGGIVGLSSKGHNRLNVGGKRHSDSSIELIGLGASPTKGGMSVGASFAF